MKSMLGILGVPWAQVAAGRFWFGLVALFFALGVPLVAAQAVVIQPGAYVSNNQPCPGDIITVYLTLQDTASPIQNLDGRLVATHPGCTTFINATLTDQWWAIYSGINPTSPVAMPNNPAAVGYVCLQPHSIFGLLLC